MEVDKASGSEAPDEAPEQQQAAEDEGEEAEDEGAEDEDAEGEDAEDEDEDEDAEEEEEDAKHARQSISRPSHSKGPAQPKSNRAPPRRTAKKPPTEFEPLSTAVWQQYEMRNKPAAVINVQLPPGDFDVNVTPDKRKVFVTGEAALLEALKAALHELWSPNRYTFALNQAQLLQQTTLADILQRPAEARGGGGAGRTRRSSGPHGLRAQMR
ncbi:hypothetical protein JKP88DRAFT_317762 [Tribonema minus]|uniref:DNA mismatch repair protein S5 domain-containing protein n=1 Tax=Tribonema minus TaxID=303371 RepID=A0A836CGU7_9STRA|nr:hypothetical protein JKP88DRAFT_317762 [Tribonema minus]